MKGLVILIIAAVLSGCASQGTKYVQEANLVFEATIAQCKNMYPNRYEKPVTPRVSCLQDALTEYATKLALVDPRTPLDLQNVRSAKIKLSAERFDSGAITRAEYDLIVATADSEYNSASASRNNSAIIANAAQTQARAAQAQAAAAQRPVSCTTIGNTTTCD